MGTTIFDSNRHAEGADKGLYNHSFHFPNPRVKRLTKACVIALLLLSSLLVSIQSLTMVSNHLTEKEKQSLSTVPSLETVAFPQRALV